MRAQHRTYHPIPSLQIHKDPKAYKDAPRMKSILKGACEDEPQPNSIEGLWAKSRPRTTPINLIFVLSYYAPRVGELHLPPSRDFFDIFTRTSLSSASRANAFLWLMWWYMESDFTEQDAKRNPFGLGDWAESSATTPARATIPALETLTDEQSTKENVDTEAEIQLGEAKGKERQVVMASEPSPAMVALKRARKEKSLASERGAQGLTSDGEMSELGFQPSSLLKMKISARRLGGSDVTRTPSPAGVRSILQGAADHHDMRINKLLNDNESNVDEVSPPPSVLAALPSSNSKRPRRGTARRGKASEEQTDSRNEDLGRGQPNSHLTLLSEGTRAIEAETLLGPPPSEVKIQGPPSSNQPPKRNRGATQHQSAVTSYRKQRIGQALDRRIRNCYDDLQERRQSEGAIVRAWRRACTLPSGYDSEEETAKVRRIKDQHDSHDTKIKDSRDEASGSRKLIPPMGGFGHALERSVPDFGEECYHIAKALARSERRLHRWQESAQPGSLIVQRRKMMAQGLGRLSTRPPLTVALDDLSPAKKEVGVPRNRPTRSRKRTRTKARKPDSAKVEGDNTMDVERGAMGAMATGGLEEDREGLAARDAGESDEGNTSMDEDVDMEGTDQADRSKSYEKFMSRLVG